MDPKSNEPHYDFDKHLTIDEILAQQGKGPVDLQWLLDNAWPDDEPIEEFLAMLREWRGHGRSDTAA